MFDTTFAQLAGTRRNNFDFLRFFFATLVVFSHSWPIFWGRNTLEPLSLVTDGRFTLGGLAVAGFFAISGFLVTQSWEHSGSAADYLKKRLLRIYPGWTAALLFCVFVVAPLSRPSHALLLRDPRTYTFLGQLFLQEHGFLPGVFPHNWQIGVPDGQTWTLRYELICYTLPLVLGLTGLLRRRLVVLALFVALLVVINAQAFAAFPRPVPEPALPVPYFGRLDPLPLFAAYFLAGMLGYLYRDRIPHARPLLLVCLMALVLTAFTGPLAWLLFVTLPTCGAYALFYIALSPGIRMHDFGRHGDLSYGLYLYAWPVQMLIVQFFLYSFSPLEHFAALGLFAAAWLLTLPLAALSWHFVEKPFLRLKPRRDEETFPEPLPPAPALS